MASSLRVRVALRHPRFGDLTRPAIYRQDVMPGSCRRISTRLLYLRCFREPFDLSLAELMLRLKPTTAKQFCTLAIFRYAHPACHGRVRGCRASGTELSLCGKALPTCGSANRAIKILEASAQIARRSPCAACGSCFSFGRKRSTGRSWLSESRRMPLSLHSHLVDELDERIALQHAVIEQLKQEIWLRERQGPKPLRGLFVVRERDGPGSRPRDAR
jgi:hypothetical protein